MLPNGILAKGLLSKGAKVGTLYEYNSDARALYSKTRVIDVKRRTTACYRECGLITI